MGWAQWAMVAASLISAYMQRQSANKAPRQFSNLSESQQALEKLIFGGASGTGPGTKPQQSAQLIEALAVGNIADVGRMRELLMPQGDPDVQFQERVQEPFLNMFEEDVLPRFFEERSGSLFSSGTQRAKGALFNKLGDTLLQARERFGQARSAQMQFAANFGQQGFMQALGALNTSNQTMAGLLASMLGKDALMFQPQSGGGGLGNLPLMLGLMGQQKTTKPTTEPTVDVGPPSAIP